jgi:hypothetical protein
VTLLRSTCETYCNVVLSTGGLLAEAYGELIRDMWNPERRRRSIDPRRVKQVISEAAPRFAGYNQHDSQELLAFVSARFRHYDLLPQRCCSAACPLLPGSHVLCGPF